VSLGKAGVAVISLAIGFVGGVLGGSILGGGAMAGVGAAAGLETGVCSTVKAAQDLGLLTPEDVDAVLAKAAQNAGAKISPAQASVGSAEACNEFIAKTR